MSGAAARPPGRRGFWVAAVVLALTAVCVVLLAVSGVRTAGDSRIRALGPEAVLRVGDRPVAVYVDGRADGVTCSVDGPDGATDLRTPDTALSVGRWDRAGVTPDVLPPGRYRVVCGGTDDVRLGAGIDPPVAGLAARFVGAVAVGALGLVVAVAIVGVTVWRRVRARRVGALR